MDNWEGFYRINLKLALFLQSYRITRTEITIWHSYHLCITRPMYGIFRAHTGKNCSTEMLYNPKCEIGEKDA
jgi:hypothetical protein